MMHLMKDNHLLLFPTFVWVTEELLSERENNKIAEHILSVKDNVSGEGELRWHSRHKSPKNSFNKNYSHPVFTNLLGLIDDKAKQYAKSIKFQEWRISSRNWWWNVYDEGNYQEFHGHLPFYFSGVYFCKAPEKSSPLIFKHPNFNYHVHAYEQNEYNSDSKAIQPVERSLIIFPSNLIHCVPPGTNKDPRITISFNYG